MAGAYCCKKEKTRTNGKGVKMDKILKMRQERAKLIKQARDMLDKVEAEKRDMTDEENTNYEKIISDVDKLREKIEREEKQLELEKDLEKSINEPIKVEPESREDKNTEKKEEIIKQFRTFLRNGYVGAELRKLTEQRALQADSGEAGGYTVAPQEFVAKLIKAVDDQVFIRPLATITQVTKADSLGAPALDADLDDADWTSELGTGDEDSTMDFGKRELDPHPLAKSLKVSNKLLRVSAINIDDLVQQRFAYKFGITEEKAFLTGSGSGQPLGIFTASSDGISTSRDVSTGNETTSIKFDGLIEAKYTLKGNYWAKAKWIFHRDALKQISKLKDGDGQYIWQQSVQVGQPDKLLGFPLMMSEYVPNTFTTGQYVGALGDFSFYWIVDALDMTIQRLVELYAASNQTGFIGRLECDGMPVLEEAFVRVKLA